MRSTKVMIRMTPVERKSVEHAAKSDALPTASWARLQLLRLAKARNLATSESAVVAEELAYYQPTHPLELLSLFCGPGGVDEGFKQAGFSTRLATDLDQECVNTFASNHPTTTAFIADIRRLTLNDLDEAAKTRFCPIGVLGGPPCQSFSVSNVHQSEDDPRHQLPEFYANLLKALNRRSPISFFVFENVPGLLGERHRLKFEKFKTLFRQAGFEITEALLNAKDYGVPQDRARLFIVGINQHKHPGKHWQPPPKLQTLRTVRDAIAHLPEPALNAPGLDPATFPAHPNHWCLVPRSEKFQNGSIKTGEMRGRSFRRLFWDEPSWTVAYGHREVHIHPKGHRRLSIYEAMLLQSFPDTYRLTGNMSAQIRLVSEAVPPRMAYHIAWSIRNSLGI